MPLAAPADLVKVLIVSDTPLLAMGVQASLAALPEITTCVRCPEEVMQRDLVEEDRPDLVVIASLQHLPLLCQRLFSAQAARVPCAVVCLAQEQGRCRYGFTGSVLPVRSTEPPALRRLLRDLLGLTGEREGDPTARPTPASCLLSPAAPAPATRVSPREREIGLLVAAGLSSQEIGRRLFISPRTVEKHRANLMGKLGVTNAAALTRELIFLSWADQDRLLPVPEQLAPAERAYQAQAS